MVNMENKKNIYCAHCDHFCEQTYPYECWCGIGAKENINYWNRCKYFTWSEKIKNQENE